MSLPAPAIALPASSVPTTAHCDTHDDHNNGIEARHNEKIVNEDENDAYPLQFGSIEPNRYPQKSDPAACLFVASLSSSRTEEQLLRSVTKHFEEYGELVHVKVLSDWARRPYAFVQFAHHDDSQRAMAQAQGSLLDGRRLRIERAKVNRTLFLAKFSKQATAVDIRALLEKFGPVEEFSVLQNFQTGQSKGCGFVKFCYREDAIHAFTSLRANSKWVVEWASNVDKDAATVEVDRRSVFVGGLNSDVTVESVTAHFERYGIVTDVEIVARSHVGASFAFVRYENDDSAQLAVEGENGQQWGDCLLRVQLRETAESRMVRHASAPCTTTFHKQQRQQQQHQRQHRYGSRTLSARFPPREPLQQPYTLADTDAQELNDSHNVGDDRGKATEDEQMMLMEQQMAAWAPFCPQMPGYIDMAAMQSYPMLPPSPAYMMCPVVPPPMQAAAAASAEMLPNYMMPMMYETANGAFAPGPWFYAMPPVEYYANYTTTNSEHCPDEVKTAMEGGAVAKEE